MRQCSLLLVLLFTFSLGRGQNIRRLSTNDGLPQSFVSGLSQDDEGFIWIATRNGLARYDGKEFKIFQHLFNDSNSLTSNIINCIKKDAKSNLWIEYESGEFDVLNLTTYNVTHYIKNNSSQYVVKPIRRGWLPAADGTFWFIPRWGGVVNHKSSKEIDKYNNPDDGFLGVKIKALQEDRKKNIWVLSQKRISQFSKPLKKFIHFELPYDMNFLTYSGHEDEMIALYERNNGELMWSDTEYLYFFNPEKCSTRKRKLPKKLNDDVRWIGAGPDGEEYFEAGRIIYRFNDKAGATAMETVPNRKHDTKSFLVDNSGLLWIGTNADGVYQLDTAPGFSSYKYVEGFAEDLLNKEFNIDIHEAFEWKATDEGFLSAGYLLRSAYDKSNNLWLALKKTVYYYNQHENKFYKLPPVPIGQGEWMFIKGITINDDGEPIVVTQEGEIFTYSKLNRKWIVSPEQALLTKRLEQSVHPQDIVAENGRLWVTTTDSGLFYVDNGSKTVHHIKHNDQSGALPSNQLLGAIQDPRNRELLWIGTYQGLVCLDRNTLKSKVFTTSDGLPDNTIYSIASDSNGFFWVSTNKGLCRFDPKTRDARVFSVSHGLQGNEFNRFHQLKLPGGKIAFGGPEGWSIFNPASIKDDVFNPNVAITAIKINNAPISQGPFAKVSPNNLEQLDLKYKENTLQITFAGLQFNQPGDLTYRYKLEGYDDEWVYANERREALYTKLPPGDYNFIVNSSNTSGKWSRLFKSFKIFVSPPWWRTWWAYGAYVIFGALMVWLYIKYRIKQGILENEIILKQKETIHLKEVDEMKSRFFSNITHELRTPLTLILGPLERLRHSNDRHDRNRLTLTIKKNAVQLLDLTNQLLDLAKLELTPLKPNLVRGNPATVLESVADAFNDDARERRIALKITKPQTESEYWISLEMFERILYNLLSNALKFTPEDGKVELVLKEKDNGIKLTVKDTGIGIPSNKLPFIFDRFYRVNEDEAGKTGTGIGLSLVKELTDVQEGSIDVRSYIEGEPGSHASGTMFTVFLPYKKVIAALEMRAGEEGEEHQGTILPLMLLVEDNEELARFIIDSLETHCRIIHLGDGESGYQTAIDLIPDLIICDVIMPGRDGFEICTALKQDNRTNHIPIILLTAKTGYDDKMKGLLSGADDYITKPFHLDELNLKIQNQLQRQKRLREHIQSKFRTIEAVDIPAKTLSNYNSSDNFLNEVYRIVEKNLDDPSFKVEELAAGLGMSRTSLHRKIKAVTDMSTGEVINAYRLRKAADMLPQNFTITEVAHKTGFANPAYFSKCFKELYNITPTEYIKKVKLPIQ